MCSAPRPSKTPPPAAAPPPPAPPPEEQEIGNARRSEDMALYGGDQPNLRVDRSSFGAASGGTGLRSM